MNMISNPDVIICGAGIAGLLTGAALSKKGLKILMLEKTDRIGGRSYTQEFKKGYSVDNGFHVIRYTKKSPTWRIFKRILGEKLNLINLGSGKYFVDDAWQDFPLSVSALGTTTLFSEEERAAFGKLLAEEILRAKIEPLLDVSVAQWLETVENKYNFRSKNARLFLETLAKFILVSPGLLDQLSVGELIEGIQTGVKATPGTAGYPVGGWKALIERLCTFIEENGVIQTNSKVDKVLLQKDKVEGVLVGGNKITAPTVIVNIPCNEIFSIVDESIFDPAYVQMCKNIIPSSGIYMDFGLKGEVSGHDGSHLTADPFTMSIFTSNLEPCVAPEGEQLYTIFQPTLPEDLQDQNKVNAITDGMMDLLNRMFPGFSDHVIWKRVKVGHVIDGAIPLISQHQKTRPSIKGPIPGLYFTGDTYNGPGTGGEIAHGSAELCIKQILSDLGIE